MDLLVEKLDGSRYYLSQYKVLITEFEESAPSVTRNSMKLDQHNGIIDFGGWHTDKTIDITGYYRADDMDEEETLREKLYALLSDPDGYYITQLKTTPNVAMERPGETSGGYYDKLKDYPSHKRFLVYTEAPEMELVGNVNGTLLYKLTAEFKTIKLPYGESVPRDLDVKPNVPYIGRNLVLNSDFENATTNVNNVNSGRRSVSTDYSYQSVQSVKVSIDSGIIEQDSGVIIRPKNAQPNENYTATGWLYSDVSRTLNISGYSADWASISRFPVVLAAKTWTKFKYHFKTEASVANVGVAILVNGTTGIDIQPFYIDLVKIEPGSTPTPWSPAPEDPDYNEWYSNTYYNTNNLFIPYAGTVPCNQLEQSFAIELTAKDAASSLSFKIDDTELAYIGTVEVGDVFIFSGFSYTQNGLSIVSKTNKAYFVLQPDKPNRITCNIHGTVRIIGLQNLYA